MLPTRKELADLLKKAERNRKKTQEILRELESLMVYIDGILNPKKPSSKRPPRSNTYNLG